MAYCPAAEEICDGVDNDCNDLIDDVDADNDGVNDCTTDKCFDTVAETVPTNQLNPNHHAEVDTDGVFETNIGSSSSPNIVDSSYSLASTYGCS